MQLTIKTRNYGDLYFTARASEGQVYVRLNGEQITEGGTMYSGPTVMCMGNQKAFEKACRKWWRQRRRKLTYPRYL